MNKLELEKRISLLEKRVGINRANKMRVSESELPNDFLEINVEVRTTYINKIIKRDNLEPLIYDEILLAAKRTVRELRKLGFKASLKLDKWSDYISGNSYIGDSNYVDIMFKGNPYKNNDTAQFQISNMILADKILKDQMHDIVENV